MKKILTLVLLLSSPTFAQSQYSHRSNPGIPTATPSSITSAGAGNCPGTGCVIVNTMATTTLTVILAGSWSATLQFTCSNDGWVTTTPVAADTFTAGSLSGAPATTTAADGTYIMPTYGFRECGMFATAFASNTTMSIRLDADPSPAVPIGATGAAALQIQGNSADGTAFVGNPLVEGVGFNKVAFAPRYCDKTAVFVTLSTTATVQQIAAVAAQKIYICAYQLFASTATAGTNLSWVEGTGANCVTGPTTIGQFLTTTTTAPTTPFMFGPSNPAVVMTGTAGDALCIQQASAVNATTLAGIIWYTQN